MGTPSHQATTTLHVSWLGGDSHGAAVPSAAVVAVLSRWLLRRAHQTSGMPPHVTVPAKLGRQRHRWVGRSGLRWGQAREIGPAAAFAARRRRIAVVRVRARTPVLAVVRARRHVRQWRRVRRHRWAGTPCGVGTTCRVGLCCHSHARVPAPQLPQQVRPRCNYNLGCRALRRSAPQRLAGGPREHAAPTGPRRQRQAFGWSRGPCVQRCVGLRAKVGQSKNGWQADAEVPKPVATCTADHTQARAA